MEDRISAVQQGLLLLLVAALALALLARPHPENHRYTGALQELSAFQGTFDRSASEGLLRAQAEAQGLTPMAALAAAAQGTGVPELALRPDGPPLRPWTRTRLANLAEVDALAQPGSKLIIGVPDVKALGSALAWRLTRLSGDPLTLRSVELVTSDVSAEDIAREQETAGLRLAIAPIAAEVESANKRLEQETNVLEARRRNQASWKVVLKSMDTQKEAAATLEAKKAALSEAQKAYEAAAQRAEGKHAAREAETAPTHALARISLGHGARDLTLEIPVALALRDAVVPPLRASFAATRAAGLWEEVKTLDVAGAIAAVKDHFNWHNRSIQLGSIKLSGALALHLLPCLLPFLLLMVSARVRLVGKSYSPFSTKVPETLPRVGFRSRIFDFIVVVLLPSLTCVSAALSLYLIGQPPLLPAAMALACVVFGLSLFGKLGELQELVLSVVHSHSYPPPQRS
jgi:hypothetical protein